MPRLRGAEIVAGQGPFASIIRTVWPQLRRFLLEGGRLLVVLERAGGLALGVEAAKVIEGDGQVAEPLGIVRRLAEEFLLEGDGAGQRGGGALGIAGRAFEQAQIAVGLGQVGTALPGVFGVAQRLLFHADRFRVARCAFVGLPDALQDQAQVVLADAELAAILGVARAGSGEFLEEFDGMPVGIDGIGAGADLGGEGADLAVRPGEVGPQGGVLLRLFHEAAIVTQGLAEEVLPDRGRAGHVGQSLREPHAQAFHRVLGLLEPLVRQGKVCRGLLLFAGDQQRGGRQPKHRQQEDQPRDGDHLAMAEPPAGGAIQERGRPGDGGPAVQHPLEIVGELLGRGIAVLAALGHGLQNHRLQVGGDSWLDLPRGPGLVALDAAEEGRPLVAGKRRFQRQQLVQRRPQRVDVRAMVDQGHLARGLFGAHVADRAHQVAGPRQGCVGLAAG